MEIQTLNTEMASGAGSSPAVVTTESTPVVSEEQTPSGTTLTPEDAAGTGKGQDQVNDGKSAAAAAAGGDDDRFDKHPRFQELHTKSRESELRAIAAEAKAAALEEVLSRFGPGAQPASGGTAGHDKETPARDFDKELADMQHKFIVGDMSQDEYNVELPKLLDAKNEVRVQAILAQSQKMVQDALNQSSVTTVQQAFLKENPEFTRLQKDGTLKAIKDADPYGFQDDFSAYLTWQSQEKEKGFEKRLADAIKETEEKIMRQLKAKGGARTLGQAGAAPPASVEETDPRMKDVKKHGGMTRVLADRLAARRAAG